MAIADERVFAVEEVVHPEAQVAFFVQWNSAAVISNPVSRLFRGRQDVSSIMTGSDSFAGNVQTSKTFTIPWTFAGSELTLMFKADMEGQTNVVWVKLIVPQLPRR